MAGQEDVKDWKDALNRKVDYPTRDDLYKAIQRKMPKCYAEFKQKMATEVADQRVLKLATYPEKSHELLPPKRNNEPVKMGWEGFPMKHKFSDTKKEGGHCIVERDIFVHHVNEYLKYKELDGELAVRLPNNAPVEQRPGRIWTYVGKRTTPVKVVGKGNLNLPKPGWRTFVMYDPDNFNAPRRLYYHHLSSQTFQQVNPRLLHPALFRPTPESIATSPLPPNWRCVDNQQRLEKTDASNALKAKIKESMNANQVNHVNLTDEQKKQMEKEDREKRIELNKMTVPLAYSPRIFGGNVHVTHFPDGYYFLNSLYKTVSPYDPRTFEAKRALFKAFRQTNVQKNYQDMLMNTEPTKWLGSLYGQLASWSIAELHPNLEATTVRGYRSLYVKQYDAAGLNEAQDLGGVSRATFSQSPQYWLNPQLGLFEHTFYDMMEIDCIGMCNLEKEALKEFDKIDGPLKEAIKEEMKLLSNKGEKSDLEKAQMLLAKLKGEKAAQVEKAFDDPANWKYLKYYYVFGRFLGLALFLNMELGIYLGPTILGPLQGGWTPPWSRFHDLMEPYYPDTMNNHSGLQRIMKQAVDQILADPHAWRDDVTIDDGLQLNGMWSVAAEVADSYTKRYNTGRFRDDGEPETLNLSYEFTERDGKAQGYPATKKNLKFDEQRHNLEKLNSFVCEFAFRQQAAAIANGVKDVIPLEWLRLFTEHELRLLIGGDRQFNVPEFMEHLRLVGQDGNHSTRGETDFFERLRPALSARLTASQTFARALLQFATARAFSPVGGFKTLEPPFTIRIYPNIPTMPMNTDGQHPSASTCFNQIKLPVYLTTLEAFSTGQLFVEYLERIITDEHAAQFSAI